MTTELIRNDSALTVKLAGRLDSPASQELDKVLDGAMEGVTDLTFDLEKLDYMSSAGLRILLRAQKLMNQNGRMKVTHVNELIREIFEVTGFTEILTIE